MIPRPLAEITATDLEALIASGRIEDQRIEYKRAFPGGGEDRSTILKSVCAFANTQGGDLLIGVEAVDGVPLSLPGVEIANIDATTLSLSNQIGDGAEPPIRDVHFQFVLIDANRYVIVVRVERSWALARS